MKQVLFCTLKVNDKRDGSLVEVVEDFFEFDGEMTQDYFDEVSDDICKDLINQAENNYRNPAFRGKVIFRLEAKVMEDEFEDEDENED